MKVLGIGHVLPKPMRLAEADHPNTLQLEAIRLAGYDKYWVSNGSARAMGTQAVVAALEESGYGVDDIGFIVAGQSNIPDFIGIDFACQVGAELGGLRARTINLVEGCGSSISTWFSANSLVRHLKEGQIGVIVLAQRVSEPHLDRFGIMNAILSDGAVAAIVGRTDAPSTGCCFVYKGGHDISDTRFVDMMRFERGGGMGPVLAENHDSRQDKLGRDRIMELYRFSGSDLTAFLKLRTENTIQIIESCLAEAGWGKDSDLTLLHTLEGRQSMENLASRLGIAKEKTNVDLVAEISHMGCVDQLISLDIMRKQGRIQPGGRVAMSAISSGMKWGCCLLELQN